MKKAFLCLIITLCLVGCQTKPTTEEILRTQTEHFLELTCLLYTSPSPRDRQKSRMPSSA